MVSLAAMLRTLLALALLVADAPGADAPGADAPPVRTLDECVAIALEQHPELKAAGAAVEAARQRVWQAAAGYLPQVSADFSSDRRHTSLGATTGTAFQPRPETFSFHSTGVSLSQILFDFGQRLAAIRAAAAEERSVDADRDTQRATIVFGAKQAYFNVLAARRLLAVADETVAQARLQLAEAEARNRVGVAQRFDVTRAQVQLANAELSQVSARTAVEVALETLRNALGMAEPVTFALVDVLDVTPPVIDVAMAVEAAYAWRPEIRSLAEQRAAEEQRLTGYQREYLPSVSGAGNYTWVGNEFPLQETWTVGARINLTLVDGGGREARIREAEAALKALAWQEEALRQNVALEVRQTVLDTRESGARIEVTRKGVGQARENMDLAQGRYRGGVGTILEVTDARAVLSSAEAQYVQSLYDYQTSAAALERATGSAIADLANRKSP